MRTDSVLRAGSLALAMTVALAAIPVAFAADSNIAPQQQIQQAAVPSMAGVADASQRLSNSKSYQDYLTNLRLNPDVVSHSRGW